MGRDGGHDTGYQGLVTHAQWCVYVGGGDGAHAPFGRNGKLCDGCGLVPRLAGVSEPHSGQNAGSNYALRVGACTTQSDASRTRHAGNSARTEPLPQIAREHRHDGAHRPVEQTPRFTRIYF